MTPGDAPTAWERVELARHPQRPYALDYIRRMAADFEELHGDRLTRDDPALVGGLGSWRGMTVLFLGQQKGRTMRDRIDRNFGMMHPEGFRKALRLASIAAKFRFPVICLIDTPGAYPGPRAEENGIASAIGTAIRDWFRVGTPVVATVIGEGGSGGALGLAVADRVLMLEHAIYSVASPEACASIVWRDGSMKEQAASQLSLTSDLLRRGGVVDAIVPEPAGGAHTDHDDACRLLDHALYQNLAPLLGQPEERILHHRRERFRKMDATVGT